MKTTTTLLCLLLALLLANCGRMQVAPADKVKKFDGGAFYALPMTMLTVEIPVVEINYSWSECRDDSLMLSRFGGSTDKRDKFLKDAKLSGKMFTKTVYDLDDITINARPVPDANKVFFVNLPKRANGDQSMALVFNQLGILSKADVAVQDNTFDILTQGIGGLVSIVTSAGGLMKNAESIRVAQEAKKNNNQIPDSVICLRKKKDLIARLDAIATARFQLIGNGGGISTNMSEGALKTRLSALDDMEKQIIAELTYREKRTTYIVRRDVLVRNQGDIDQLKKEPLFKFSSKNGLTLYVPDVDEYANKFDPYIANVSSTTLAPCKDESCYTLHIQLKQTGQIANTITQPTPTVEYRSNDIIKKTSGLVYNIPVWTAAYLVKKDGDKDKESLAAVSNQMMPQFGKTAFLSAKTSKTTFELDQWGAFSTLSQNTTGLTGEQIKAAGATASSGAALFKKDPPKTELEQKQYARQLLEEETKILKTQQQLDSLRRRQPSAPISN